MRWLVAGLLLGALPALADGADQEGQDLARRVGEILKADCYRCHGQNGANEGGVNYILDLAQLVNRRKVVPNDAIKSRLMKRVQSADDPMPPEGEKPRPSGEDIAILQRWIEAGAPAPAAGPGERLFISQVDLLKRIRDNLSAVPERDRRFTRYFTLTHLYNAGLSDDELQSFRHGLSKLVNSLSWGSRVVVPQAVDPERTIFRIDLRDYQWNEKTWDAILAQNPYGITLGTVQARQSYELTGCEQPHVRADWFVAAAARPPLYHQILRLPGSEVELEKLLRLDVLENLRQEKVARAGFNGSGVSRNNRLLERHDSGGVVYWKSYDFGGNVGRQNLFAHPLGPGDAEAHFRHDGGEIIFTLPNGLHAFFLADAEGRRLDKGPLAIVSDPRRPDRAVENGISCMSCHARGLLDKHDQVRDHVLKNPDAFAATTRETVAALYPPRDKLSAFVQEDTKRFREAVARTGAPLSASEPIVVLTERFESELDLRLAAAEASVEAANFLKALERSPRLARRLGPLRLEGGTVQRQAFVASFAELVRVLELGTFLRPAAGPASRALALGNELLNKGDAVAAVKAFGEAVEHDPDNPIVYLSRGDAYRSAGDLAKALTDFTEAIRLAPELPAGYQNRAGVFHDRGEFDRAIADYTEALRLDPKDAVTRNNRGLARMDQGTLKEAIVDFTEAIRLSPEYATAYNNRGLARARLGQHDQAIADYGEAIRLDPKYVTAYHNRGAARLARNEFDAAIKDYTEVLRLKADWPTAYNNRGLAHYHRRDFPRAIADFTEAIRLDPKFARAYFNRSAAYRERGDAVLANADRATALRLDPSLAKK